MLHAENTPEQLAALDADLAALVARVEAKQWAGVPISDEEDAAYHAALITLAQHAPDAEPEPPDSPEFIAERAARRARYGGPWF